MEQPEGAGHSNPAKADTTIEGQGDQAASTQPERDIRRYK